MVEFLVEPETQDAETQNIYQSSSSGVLREKLLHGQWAREHSLLLGERDHVLDVVIVFLHTLVERMLAEEFSLFFQI